MDVADIQLALGGDKGNTISKFFVTASEIAVLREIHGDESVTDILPRGQKQISHRAERERLLAIYGAAKNADQRPIVESLFPGVAARLFETLAELELPEDFFKATQRVAPAPVERPVAEEPTEVDTQPAESQDVETDDGIGEIRDDHAEENLFG